MQHPIHNKDTRGVIVCSTLSHNKDTRRMIACSTLSHNKDTRGMIACSPLSHNKDSHAARPTGDHDSLCLLSLLWIININFRGHSSRAESRVRRGRRAVPQVRRGETQAGS